MELAEFLFDLLTWLVSVGITFGTFCLLLWVFAFLIDKGYHK